MLGLIGINHNSAPLEIREKFAFAQDEIIPFSEHLSEQANFNDIVILSTCNRTEIYFSQNIYGEETALNYLKKAMLSFKHEDALLSQYTYMMTGEDAVKHLFRVTSGVDSMVVGEDQIIGQVKEAYLYCTKAALTDAVLMRLFQKSFEAGKRVRTETKIKQGATSVSYVAVDMCKKIFHSLEDKSALIIGAGETSGLAIQGLHKQGLKHFTIANRTIENIRPYTDKYKAAAVSLDKFPEYLPGADIIIVATGAATPVLQKNMADKALEHSAPKPRLFIDLSVPRNIEPDVANNDSCTLITIDDLQMIIDKNTDSRKSCIADAEIIIDEVASEFTEWLSFRALRPAIRAIKYNLQKIHRDELQTYHEAYTDDEKKAIEDFTRKLISKYERSLIKNLKYFTENGKNSEYLDMINKLFRLK